ncbi:MAG TPA: hypothetical protein VFO05_14630 [Candidatus Limnocylindrales bacterium]|nr:hypothetical protein [Candidatus Limnocylindrales bacterium]
MTIAHSGTTRIDKPLGAAIAAILAIGLAGCSTAATPSVEPGGSAPVSPSSSAEGPTPGSTSNSPSAPPPSASAGDLADLPTVEGTLNDVLIGDGIVVTAGFSGPRGAPSILVYEDGAWSTAVVPGTRGQVMGLAQLGGQLIAVGNELPDARTGFIWTSEDGRSWTEATSIDDAALYEVVATHDVAVAVGAHLDEEMASVAASWTSSDGEAWSEGVVEGADGSSIRSVTVWSGGFAASGEGPNEATQPIWTAVDPAEWTSLTTDLEPPRIVIEIVDWAGGLAAAGASDKSGNQHPFVALSGDGAAWTQTMLSPDEEGYASSIALAGETLVAAGVDADRLTLWTLAGDAWQPQTIEPEGATISAMAWTPDLGLVGVGSKGGNQALWRLGGD